MHSPAKYGLALAVKPRNGQQAAWIRLDDRDKTAVVFGHPLVAGSSFQIPSPESSEKRELARRAAPAQVTGLGTTKDDGMLCRRVSGISGQVARRRTEPSKMGVV
ncbi:hypothetical protein QQZ08_008630 [Neonectria magnoliae]|uniref:Uncharacterized protein n=1 Tax=Neonectria magnoliae TaxID=2732573 RepID=A0ABR1HTS8_9HYPO